MIPTVQTTCKWAWSRGELGVPAKTSLEFILVFLLLMNASGMKFAKVVVILHLTFNVESAAEAAVLEVVGAASAGVKAMKGEVKVAMVDSLEISTVVAVQEIGTHLLQRISSAALVSLILEAKILLIISSSRIGKGWFVYKPVMDKSHRCIQARLP